MYIGICVYAFKLIGIWYTSDFMLDGNCETLLDGIRRVKLPIHFSLEAKALFG